MWALEQLQRLNIRKTGGQFVALNIGEQSAPSQSQLPSPSQQ
jgi:hypothetical protein